MKTILASQTVSIPENGMIREYLFWCLFKLMYLSLVTIILYCFLNPFAPELPKTVGVNPLLCSL